MSGIIGNDAYRLFALLGVFLCSACTDSAAPTPPTLLLEPTRVTYAPGDSVTLSASNLTGGAIGVSTCGVALERWDENRWTDLGVANDGSVCGDGRVVLETGQTYDLMVRPFLPSDLPNGAYRIRIPSAQFEGATSAIIPALNRESAAFLVQQ